MRSINMPDANAAAMHHASPMFRGAPSVDNNAVPGGKCSVTWRDVKKLDNIIYSVVHSMVVLDSQ